MTRAMMPAPQAAVSGTTMKVMIGAMKTAMKRAMMTTMMKATTTAMMTSTLTATFAAACQLGTRPCGRSQKAKVKRQRAKPRRGGKRNTVRRAKSEARYQMAEVRSADAGSG